MNDNSTTPIVYVLEVRFIDAPQTEWKFSHVYASKEAVQDYFSVPIQWLQLNKHSSVYRNRWIGTLPRRSKDNEELRLTELDVKQARKDDEAQS